MARGKPKNAPAPVLGYSTGFESHYELQHKLGEGGNAAVRLGRHKTTGRTAAVKSIPKVLNDPNASERKKKEQIPYLKREVEVLLALRGTLNVANLEEVYEDDSHVHLVLELCSGGELLARTTKSTRHYSERTAASYLRAVLRTVAQCHAKRVIHRDIKPENFLFLSEDEASPIKAIDFGLAVFYDPQQLPLVGLNPEGTPWYLAPECCRAKWHPASDVWAVGVMACYLLTGAYPFLDRISPKMPDLARTLRSICFEELDLDRKELRGLSEDARHFITALLVKDPLMRPSATEALRHPFLKGTSSERSAGQSIDQSVVQRIQRFAQSSLFKRTVLEHIAADLLTMHFKPQDASSHGGKVFRDRSVRGGMAFAAAADGDMQTVHESEGSAHGIRHSFRAAASAALSAVGLDRSVHGGSAEGSRRGVRDREGSRRGGADREGSRRGGHDRDGSRRGYHDSEGSRRGGMARLQAAAHSASARSLHRAGSASLESSMHGGASALLPVATPYSQRLAQLFDRLQLKPGQKMDQKQLQLALQEIGYHLHEAEAHELFDAVDVERRGALSQAELAAGLIDWKAFQDTYKDRWLDCARRAFAELDVGGRGALDASDIAAAFGSHLTPYEVDAAVHQALLEATGGAAAASVLAATAVNGEGGEAGAAAGRGANFSSPPIDFDHFLGLLRSQGPEDLELFESRLGGYPSRLPSMSADDLAPVGLQQRSTRGKPGAGSGGGAGPACCIIS
ncbi:hypothetical protein D9Q98_007742 [Chlorella vulgaris]|uniref:Protein kinase domain-containing protein n=1 Tax=Chlorella vulgaris TaxID=3077 RepID=A0A9D4THG5_CHLVU|nr:hypothetical protein D9Q98_007742 [Chlorella vulgaris]